MIPDGALVLNLTPALLSIGDGAILVRVPKKPQRTRNSAIFFCRDDINEAARPNPPTDCLCDQSNMASLSVLVPFAS